MPLTAAARRESRAHRAMANLARLANIDVQPARAAEGRIITIAVRSTTLNGASDSDPLRLLNYIRPWWSTLQRVGLRGTLLHSGWTAAQIAEVVTEQIQVVAVQPGPRHIFHERHFLVREYLRSIDDPYVFVTDGSDVAFRRDPFDLVRAAAGHRKLFIGREKRLILFCKCVRQEMRRQFGRIWHPLRPVLNPGIIGGRREVVLDALGAICDLIDSLGDRLIASDMCIVNRAIYGAFATNDLETGEPLHSRFKGWEFETSAAIMHK
jgi:hypothetical protein